LPPAVDCPVTAPVQRVNPAERPDWDALLAAHPGLSFFHGAAWAKVLASAYGYAPAYFLLEEAGAARALLPLMEVDSWLTGRRGVGLPFTDDCEPLYSDPGLGKKLVQSVFEFGRARRWKYAEFRGGRELFEGVQPSLSFYGHELDLTGDEDRLFARLESSVRRAIRKSEKSGLTVEVTQTLAAMQAYYSLHCQTRKKHGMPPQSFGFFQNVHEHIVSRNKGIIVLACYQGNPAAGAIHFYGGRQAVYKFGASDESFQHLRGSNLVMWEAIKWLARNGSKSLHFGRTSIANEGLRKFKLGWGTKEHRMDYFKYDLQKDRYVTDTDESSGWHNQVFKALPAPISRVIGAALYKHWA
jgi:CelD/BcsL family acetyltransferase involved in cellulose biosynthesis